MPSFDIVSQVDLQEVENAINQAKKEVGNRFDFRGSKAAYDWDKKNLRITAEDDYKMDAMKSILQTKLHRRGIDIKAMKFNKPEQVGGMMMKQEVEILQGIDREIAKKINKSIKDSKLKVQSQVQDDKVKVNSKSIDALQECMSYIKTQEFGIPLQFENMRS